MGIHSTNNEWFQYFPLKSYFTKTDSKNTFDCYCNIAKQYFNIKYFGTMVNLSVNGNIMVEKLLYYLFKLNMSVN